MGAASERTPQIYPTPVLNALATKLKDGTFVTITGYAHGNGALARKRAENVTAYLRKRGSVHVKIKFVTTEGV